MKKLWLIFAALVCWTAGGVFIQQWQTGTDRDTATPPMRIVSAAPNLTEILFALGLDDRIAAVTTNSNYPTAAAGKPKIGNFWQPDIEAVISAGPDLVLTLGFERQANLARRLERAGYNTLSLDIETIEQFYAAVERIGSVTDSEAAAAELLGRIKNRIAGTGTGAVQAKRLKVLLVIQRKPMRVVGRGTFVDEMIELAGGVNAVGPTLHKYPPIGAEQLVGSSPDVIIETADSGVDPSRQRTEALDYYRRFSDLPAVKTGRIYVISADSISRLGPRLHEGVEAIAGCLFLTGGNM